MRRKRADATKLREAIEARKDLFGRRELELLARLAKNPDAIKKTDKAKLRRLAAEIRRKKRVELDERRAEREARWVRRQRIKSGLPLIDVAKFGFGDE